MAIGINLGHDSDDDKSSDWDSRPVGIGSSWGDDSDWCLDDLSKYKDDSDPKLFKDE